MQTNLILINNFSNTNKVTYKKKKSLLIGTESTYIYIYKYIHKYLPVIHFAMHLIIIIFLHLYLISY
jgi:hypothetical protein